MDLLGCAEIRPRLAASYDGELSVEGQIAIDTHVMGCAACAGDARRLEAIGRALRARTVSRNALADTAAGLAITVVSRMSAERDQSVKARVGRLFEDMHLVWAALGAVTSTACCILLIAATMYFTGPGRTDSLAAIMTAMASPGSNANPVRLDQSIQVPRVHREAIFPGMLVGRRPGDNGGYEARGQDVALAATVTREGTIAGLEVLLADGHGEEVMLSLLDVAAAVRFEPASFAGSPVAVNMVWLLAHTTVRGG